MNKLTQNETMLINAICLLWVEKYSIDLYDKDGFKNDVTGQIWRVLEERYEWMEKDVNKIIDSFDVNIRELQKEVKGGVVII